MSDALSDMEDGAPSIGPLTHDDFDSYHGNQCDSRFLSVCGDSQRCNCGLDMKVDRLRATVLKKEVEIKTLEANLASGDASDGYHTHRELYAYRKAFNALLFNEWAAAGMFDVHKSWRHGDGEPCFGGGWFIVSAQTAAGQVTNHYKSEDWPLFQIPERERAAAWDGHTPAEALSRLLRQAAIGAATRGGRNV